jgi:hypothetical protein
LLLSLVVALTELKGTVLFARAEEPTYPDDERGDLAVAIDQHIHDLADLVVRGVIDVLLVPVGHRHAVGGKVCVDLGTMCSIPEIQSALQEMRRVVQVERLPFFKANHHLLTTSRYCLRAIAACPSGVAETGLIESGRHVANRAFSEL